MKDNFYIGAKVKFKDQDNLRDGIDEFVLKNFNEKVYILSPQNKKDIPKYWVSKLGNINEDLKLI